MKRRRINEPRKIVKTVHDFCLSSVAHCNTALGFVWIGYRCSYFLLLKSILCCEGKKSNKKPARKKTRSFLTFPLLALLSCWITRSILNSAKNIFLSKNSHSSKFINFRKIQPLLQNVYPKVILFTNKKLLF